MKLDQETIQHYFWLCRNPFVNGVGYRLLSMYTSIAAADADKDNFPAIFSLPLSLSVQFSAAFTSFTVRLCGCAMCTHYSTNIHVLSIKFNSEDN